MRRLYHRLFHGHLPPGRGRHCIRPGAALYGLLPLCRRLPDPCGGHPRYVGGGDLSVPPDSPLLRAIQSRRAIRHFKEKLPDKALIQRALDGAAYAPSGKNEHRNRWTVVYGRARVEELYQLVLEWAGPVEHYKHLVWLARKGIDPVTCGAPCLIIGHNHPEALNPQDDTVIATLLAEQLLVESGLGTCWSGYFRTAAQNSADIQRRLALPEGHRVYSVLMVGVPAERYPNIPHRPRCPGAVGGMSPV